MNTAGTTTAKTEESLSNSRALFDRAQLSLAGGVSTAFRVNERPHPLFFRSASGSKLVDVDGNEYLDFVCGFGPVLLGHGDERVAGAVARAASSLQQTGGQHEAEVELAERLCRLVPSFEVVRFSVSGSEAIQGALRLARAVTGRSLVLKFAGHYHGWLDGTYVATAGMAQALPDTRGQPTAALADVVVIEWGDPEALEALFAQAGPSIAAVIMEPIPCNPGVMYPPDGYMERVRALTAEHGTMLVFDEVITGFRLGLGGAQERLGVVPDLTIVAKAMANGFPLSAFGGARETMALVASNEVVHAGTYNGGGISIAAGQATLNVLEADSGIYGRLEKLGARLMRGLEECAASHDRRLLAQGPGPVFFTWFTDADRVSSFRDHLQADSALYASFAEQMIYEGVRIIPAGRWFLTTAHDDADVDRALEAADAAFARIGG